MRVQVVDITEAMNKVGALMSDEKVIPGVLMKFVGDKLHICCNNGRKAVITKVDVEYEDGDNVDGKEIVLDYNNFNSVISSCQAKGSIIVKELIFSVLDNVVKFTIEKQIRVIKDEEEVFLLGGVNTTEIAWKAANADMKTAMLTRIDYDDLFNYENADQYTAKELKDIMSRVVGEKNRVVYLSPKNGSVFVANTGYMVTINIYDKGIALVLKGDTSKAMLSILSKEKDDTGLYITTQDKYVKLISEDNRFAAMWEMGAVMENHITQLNHYNAKPYQSVMLDMHKEMLLDTLNSMLASINTATNTPMLNMEIEENADGYELVLSCSGSNNSIKGGYRVICEGAIVVEYGELSHRFNIKNLIDMLSKCNTDYVAVDFDINDNAKAIRVSEMDTDSRLSYTYALKEQYGMGADEVLPIEDKIKIRSSSLNSKMYSMLS